MRLPRIFLIVLFLFFLSTDLTSCGKATNNPNPSIANNYDFGLTEDEQTSLRADFDQMSEKEQISFIKSLLYAHQGSNGALKSNEFFCLNIDFLDLTLRWYDMDGNSLVSAEDIDADVVYGVGTFLTITINRSDLDLSFKMLYNILKVEPIRFIRNISSVDLVKEMKIGWSLGNTLDSWDTAGPYLGNTDETLWGNAMTTKDMIDEVKAAGFNVIRIPVTWYGHFDEVTYEIDEDWLDRVQELVHFALAGNETFVVINTHHETLWTNATYNNQVYAETVLTALWEQIALRFKNYDEHLLFTGLGEPRIIGVDMATEWLGTPEGYDVVNQLNQAFVDTVRGTGGNNVHRHLMIPSYAGSGHQTPLSAMIVPQDDKVIVTVDSYVPFAFAHNNSINNNQWSRINPYDCMDIDDLMSNLNQYFISQGIPVIISEFAARDKRNLADRIDWATYYLEQAKVLNIPCIWWDTGVVPTDVNYTFCIFDRRNLEWKFPTLVTAMMDVVHN